MQPKRITIENQLSQRTEVNYKQSATKLSVVPNSFTEPARSFSQHDFAPDEFVSADFAPMEYALPDLSDAPVFRLISARAANGEVSDRAQSFYQICKRALDISASVVLLILASPLLVVIALVVKVSSKGPVFFAHTRLGRNGKEFDCLKFRTMSVDAEERMKQDPQLRRRFEEKFKLEDDPRITGCGAFLRRTSLDELPQFFHVLRGEMSLIGPRPIVRNELSKYSIYGRKLLSVKPGLSGLWQVCGRSDTTYPERVMMDMQYIDHRCLWLDMRLLLLTASAVLRKSGAC
jgi:lipopolysaccharide/colanic/teichoic acid biosynthesis glycosyltransferase